MFLQDVVVAYRGASVDLLEDSMALFVRMASKQAEDDLLDYQVGTSQVHLSNQQ
jgi:hypothetical protein